MPCPQHGCHTQAAGVQLEFGMTLQEAASFRIPTALSGIEPIIPVDLEDIAPQQDELRELPHAEPVALGAANLAR